MPDPDLVRVAAVGKEGLGNEVTVAVDVTVLVEDHPTIAEMRQEVIGIDPEAEKRVIVEYRGERIIMGVQYRFRKAAKY
jgi:hypothetical protein